MAFEVLKAQLATGLVPKGLVLLESHIADHLKVGRAPVRRALELLCESGIIRRFSGRGYLVGGPEDDSPPLRMDLAEAGFFPPPSLDQDVAQFTWERIFGTIEESVWRTIPFGTYHIVESALTDHFKVSRTVAREALGRLRDRGLIQKNRWSTWVAGPLTSRLVDECFDLRALLEPQALREIGPIPAEAIASMDRRLDEALGADGPCRAAIDEIEDDLHRTLLGGAQNRKLRSMIVECQLPMVVNQLFHQHFGAMDYGPMLSEHSLVLKHLRLGSTSAAATSLAAHIDAARRRTKDRLKVLSVLPEPAAAPYLEIIR